jgi:DNA-binding XRE family transcriptional regulator
VHVLAVGCKAPEVLITVGDHIRRRRLERHLLQHDVANAIGVAVPTILGRTAPTFRHMRKNINFLGYNPIPRADTRAKRLVQARAALRLSQKQYADHIGVPWWKLAMWEQGLQRPVVENARLCTEPPPTVVWYR